MRSLAVDFILHRATDMRRIRFDSSPKSHGSREKPEPKDEMSTGTSGANIPEHCAIMYYCRADTIKWIRVRYGIIEDEHKDELLASAATGSVLLRRDKKILKATTSSTKTPAESSSHQIKERKQARLVRFGGGKTDCGRREEL